VFVATGTGIAPFSAMALSGVSNFTLLHGVNTSDDLYYAELFRAQAAHYVPCLSEQTVPLQGAFQGRVTAYLEQQLPPGKYTFYLCGRQAMIHDATHLIDERFHGSKIYTEIFY
jgi:ferredoxin-NADP reductase